MSAAERTSMIELWASWEGHVVNGVYPLRRNLGSSDHSGVFLTEARNATTSEVAIKIVPAVPGLAESQLSRWLTAAATEHANLVRIFEAGRCQVNGRPYLYALMEYADQDLAQLLQRRALTEEETREMLVPTLSALAFLHEKKLVQGRVKPSNVLVVGDQLKLASDTVHRAGEAVDATHALSAYDPPELRETGRSAAGDIWALGVTMCEALTRRQPLALHGGGNPVFPVDLSYTFRELVAWCLSRRPSDRPEVSELAASLRGERTVPVAILAVEPSVSDAPPDAAPADTAPADTAPADTAPINAVPGNAARTDAAAVAASVAAAVAPAAAAALVDAASGDAASVDAARNDSAPSYRARSDLTPPAALPAAPPAEGPTATAAPPSPSIAPAAAQTTLALGSSATMPAAPQMSAARASAEARATASAPLSSAPTQKPAIQVVVEEPRIAAPDSRQPSAGDEKSNRPSGGEEWQRPSGGEESTRRSGGVDSKRPWAGEESTRRYALWAGSVAVVVVIAWGGMKLLSGPSSEADPDTVAEVSTGGASDANPNASDDGVSSETDDAARAPSGATRVAAAANGDGAPNAASRAPASTSRLPARASTLASRAAPPARTSAVASGAPPPSRASTLASRAAPPARLVPTSSSAAESDLAPSETNDLPSGGINEVIPDVPASASRTIRGRVRVSVRVIVEKDGTVFAALADNPGPSRYFERAAIDAAKKWTFAPVDTDEQRLMLIRFTFTRQGTTASATALQ